MSKKKKIKSVCQFNCYRQVMTLVDKGHIFTLFDNGVPFPEVAEITGFSVNRVAWVIEGIRGTNTWLDAKRLYKEELDETKLYKDADDVKLQREVQNTSGKDRSQDSVTSGRNRYQSSSRRTHTKTVSKYNIGRRSATSSPQHIGSTSVDSHRGGDTLVDGLRKHKEYKGE